MNRREKRKIRVLVTGGPTRAYLDRVRFLSNLSTGAVAFEICKELCRRGIEVALVVGPSDLPFEDLPLKICRRVETFAEMRDGVHSVCKGFRPEAAVFSAAVLDFLPARVQKGKVSSKVSAWNIQLKPAPKIIDEVRRKFPRIRRVGFKLEWDVSSRAAAVAYGEKVVKSKALDALCLNYLSKLKGDRHPALLFRSGEKPYAAKNKKQIAAWIANFLTRNL